MADQDVARDDAAIGRAEDSDMRPRSIDQEETSGDIIEDYTLPAADLDAGPERSKADLPGDLGSMSYAAESDSLNPSDRPWNTSTGS